MIIIIEEVHQFNFLVCDNGNKICGMYLPINRYNKLLSISDNGITI